MSHILSTIQDNVIESVATGAVGGVISKFVLNRNGTEYIFGFGMPEWQIDTLLLVAESAFADIVGEWAIPTVEQHLIGNEGLANALKQAVPPGFTGLWHAGAKIYAVNPYSQSITHEFLLGAGSKLAGNAISQMI